MFASSHSDQKPIPAFKLAFEVNLDTDNSTTEGSECASEDWTVASDSDKEDTASRPYPCPFPDCTQRFKRSYTLKDHINAHTGERPFVCPVSTCRRSFGTSGNLARHKRIHPWLSKPLPCLVDGCGCVFTSDVKLERHLKTHFSEASGHWCMAPACGKAFSTPGNLRRHMRINHNHKNRPTHAAFTTAVSEVKQEQSILFDSATAVPIVGNGKSLDDPADSTCDQYMFETLSWLLDDEEMVECVAV